MNSSPQVALQTDARPNPRFRLDHQVGRGGIGAVYKAYDIELERVVAVKLLHASLITDEEACERLRREFRLASKINHENVIRVYDVSRLHGALLLSMDFIAGETLADLLKRETRLDVDSAIHLATQLCEALAAAHRTGVIHRDVKPQNILVGDDRRLVLIDFGTGKALSEAETALTRSDARPGTLAYMSPEQTMGLPVDQRTDIYSFGLVFQQMLTGRLGRTPDGSGFEDQPSQVPAACREVIRKCLAENPADRYIGAEEIVAALVQSGNHTSRAGGGPGSEAVRRRPQRRLGFAMIAVLLVLGVAGALNWRAGTPSAESDLQGAVPALYLQATTALDQATDLGGLESAADLFEQVRQRHPRHALALAGLAEAGYLIFERSHDADWLTRAGEAADAAIAIDGDSPRLAALRASIYIGEGRYSEAIARLRGSIVNSSATDETYRVLGKAHLLGGNSNEALRALETAVELKPDNWLNHNALGIGYLRSGSFDAAATRFHNAIELAPGQAAAHANLGTASLSQGDLEGAIAWFETALALDESSANYNNLGIATNRQGKHETAILLLEKAVELDPRSDVPLGNLAFALEMAGKADLSRAAYIRAMKTAEESLKTNPKDAEATGRLALYYAKCGARQMCHRVLDRARSLDPWNPRLLYYQAVLALVENDRGQCLDSLRAAVQHGYPSAFVASDPELASLRSLAAFQAIVEMKSAAP